MAKRAKKKAVGPGLPEGESKLSTNVPDEVHRKLKAVAALRGVSIRDLLIEYSDSLELKIPKQSRRRR